MFALCALHFHWRLINFARFCFALRTPFAPMYSHSHSHSHSLYLSHSPHKFDVCLFLLICLPSFGVVVIETIHVLINFQTTTKYFILLFCCCFCYLMMCFILASFFLRAIQFFFLTLSFLKPSDESVAKTGVKCSLSSIHSR